MVYYRVIWETKRRLAASYAIGEEPISSMNIINKKFNPVFNNSQTIFNTFYKSIPGFSLLLNSAEVNRKNHYSYIRVTRIFTYYASIAFLFFLKI